MFNDYQDKLRYHINCFIFENGFAPSVNELATLSKSTQGEVEQALKTLADNHSLVLHPKSFDIWVAPPFALFPTLFWVANSHRHWWGNCAWCSLGIASLTKSDTDIFTRLKGEEEPIVLQIRNKEVIQRDFVMHLPIPAKKFWDNVIYTCSMMLVFKNESEVDDWCRKHNKPKGVVLSIKNVWELANIWYGYYLNPDFKHKSKEVAESMFKQLGLTSEFWKL